ADGSAVGDEMRWPFPETITSPWVSPAPAAGAPGTVPAMVAPAPSGTPLAAALLADWIATPRNAVGPMCTVAEELLPSIWWAMETAWLIGMANAWVCWFWNSTPCEAAVLTPMICPSVFTSGPPESPGWMPALWWISPVSCSEVPAPSSEAVIDAPRLAMWPVATDGVPPLPSALPRATTFWPVAALLESPSVTGAGPDAPRSWMAAMSGLWSAPAPLAWYVRPLPMSRALMEVAPLIT